MNYFDMFHGIGGFALAAYLAGMKFDNHFCSDIEPYCRELYQLRFPDSIQLGDITKIDYEELKNNYDEEWIITGGFPCQPHSIAGQRRASEDERDLWDECVRAIRVLRPRFALFENVPGLFISEQGLFFNRVLADLAESGYACEWDSIRAEDVGAPHRRERIWIVAYPFNCSNRTDRKQERETQEIQGKCWETRYARLFSGTGISKKILAYSRCELREQGNAGRMEAENGKRTYGELHDKSSSERQREIPDTDSMRYIYGQNEIESTQGREYAQHNTSTESKVPDTERTGCNKGYKYKERQASRRFGEQHENWKIEPAICELVDGIPAGLDGYEGRLSIESYKRNDQLKGLGNSIVPQVAEILFELIKEHL